jgi:hypothetical protein
MEYGWGNNCIKKTLGGSEMEECKGRIHCCFTTSMGKSEYFPPPKVGINMEYGNALYDMEPG